MFKAYSRRISLHLIKTIIILKIGGGHCGFPHCSAVCPCHSWITAMDAMEQHWMKLKIQIASDLLVWTLPKPTHPLISLGQQVAHGVTVVRSSSRKRKPGAEEKGNKRKQQLWANNHVLPSAAITHSNTYKDLAPLGSVWLRENCCDSTTPGKQWWPTADGRKHFYGVYCFSKARRIPSLCIPLLLGLFHH